MVWDRALPAEYIEDMYADPHAMIWVPGRRSTWWVGAAGGESVTATRSLAVYASGTTTGTRSLAAYGKDTQTGSRALAATGQELLAAIRDLAASGKQNLTASRALNVTALEITTALRDLAVYGTSGATAERAAAVFARAIVAASRVAETFGSETITVAGWTATEAGTAAANDSYVEAGTLNGKAYYVGLVSGWYLYWGGMTGAQWRLDPVLGKASDFAYYGVSPGGLSLPANPWNVGAGDAPAPTVAAAGIPVVRHLAAWGAAATVATHAAECYAILTQTALRTIAASGYDAQTASRTLAAIGAEATTATRELAIWGVGATETITATRALSTWGAAAVAASRSIAAYGLSSHTATRTMLVWGWANRSYNLQALPPRYNLQALPPRYNLQALPPRYTLEAD